MTTRATINANDDEKIQNNTIATLTNICLAVKAMWKNHNIYCVSLLRVSDVEGPEPDFTDEEYQNLLPSLARSTASKAIKNNLTVTEIKAAPDISTNQRKAQNILRRHHEHKAAERILNPGRSSMIKWHCISY